MPESGSGKHSSRAVGPARHWLLIPASRALAWARQRPALMWCWRGLGRGAAAVRRSVAATPALLVRGVRALPTGLDHLRKVAFGVVAIFVIVWIVNEFLSDEYLVFEDIHVHGNLAAQLPPGKRLAGRVGTHFDHLSAAIERLRDKKDAALKPDVALPNLEIPGAQVTVQAAVELARRILRVRERRIGGDIFTSTTPLTPPPATSFLVGDEKCGDAKSVYVVVRLSSNRGELAEPVETHVCLGKAVDSKGEVAMLDSNLLESLLQLAALRAYERVNPCGSAAYYFYNWYRRSLDGRMLDAGFRRTSQTISACLAEKGPGEAAHANHLLGRIRQHTNQSKEALDYFEAAELMHRRAQWTWRLWLHDRGWWQIRFPRDLFGHWGSALLDVGRPDIALRMFRRQIEEWSDSSLGYIGVGNALKVMAAADPAKLAEALNAYCTGARHLRYDLEIRHALADFLEEHHGAVGRCPDTTPDDESAASSKGERVPKELRKNPALAYAFRQRLKTVDLMPTEPRYGLALGRSLRKVGAHAEAAKIFERVLAFSPGASWEAYVELAATYEAMQRPKKVGETFERAREALAQLAVQQPFNAEVRYLAALASLRLRDYAGAIEWAETAVAREPDASEARYAMACANWLWGKAAPARSHLEAARMKDSGGDDLRRADGILRECVAEVDLGAKASSP